MLTKLFILLAAWSLIACQQNPTAADAPEPPADQQPVAPPSAPGPAAPSPQPLTPQLDPGIDDLLTRLETSAAGLKGFTADITYIKEDAILGRKETRTGELLYKLDDAGENGKRFAVLFKRLVIPPRAENREKLYIFDGRWLAEIDPAEKQFIKREVVAPGKHVDPLKLGEGPFPLPVGQSKSEVLARFDVTAAELPKEGPLKDLQNVEGLLLVPKPNTRESRDYAKVEIFYDRETLLPVGIHAEELEGHTKIVRLSNAKRNPEFDEAALKKLDFADPDPREWRISIEPWRGE